MNFREKMKRFWTLDVHNHEGFTLVELIIVIAILAILSTGAIAGYSVYVEQANITADESMVAELKNVLTLAMYNGDLSGTGVIVLDTNGVVNTADLSDEVVAALTSAYDTNWQTALKLKYADWKIAPHLNGLSAEYAAGLKNSSYLSGDRNENLLSDVEKFTSMAHNLAGAFGNVNGVNTSLASLYGYELLNRAAEKYGIATQPSNEAWDTWGEANPAEFANLLVMATAMDSDDMITNGVSGAQSTGLVLGFSKYYAFAAICPAFNEFFTEHMEKLNDVTTPAEGNAWKLELEAEAAKTNLYKTADGKTFADYEASDACGTDQAAFALLMSSLSKTSADDVSSDLGNANLFTDGVVKDMFDDYMNTVDAMAGGSNIELTLQNGQVAIIYNQGTMLVSDTLSK